MRKSVLTWNRLKQSALLGLAEEMRTEAADARVNALRRSVEIEPNPRILDRLEFEEEHRRGEVLVAAVMRAFLSAWVARITRLCDDPVVAGLYELIFNHTLAVAVVQNCFD